MLLKDIVTSKPIELLEVFTKKMTSKSETPRKINMEPINHPFGKENHLPNPHDYVPC